MPDSRNNPCFHKIVFALFFVAVVAVTIPNPSADPGPLLGPNATLRVYATGGERLAPFRLRLPAAGIVTVEVAATGSGDATAQLALVQERFTPADGAAPATVIERSATHLVLAARGPGILGLRVAAQDPRSPADSYKIITSFAEAEVRKDTFLPEAVDDRLRVTRTRFYAAGITTQAEPEVVDPDPGRSSPAGGRLLASVATWQNASLAIQAEPEVVDPDPGTAADPGVPAPPDQQVLFYEGACGPTPPEEADDHADSTACATAFDLAAGRRLAGEIGNRWHDDSDLFRFVLDAPATIDVTTRGHTDTFGVLHDRSGQRLTANDDGGEGRNFRIVRTLLPGRYFVRVEGAGGAEGAYELSITVRGW